MVDICEKCMHNQICRYTEKMVKAMEEFKRNEKVFSMNNVFPIKINAEVKCEYFKSVVLNNGILIKGNDNIKWI